LSNVVSTPSPGAVDAIEGHWKDIAEDYERIYAMSGGEASGSEDLRAIFQQQLQRPMPSSDGGSSGSDIAADVLGRTRHLPLDVDAELIIYGSTAPGCSISLGGDPVKLQNDGTFTVRVELPDRRQVLPVTACSRDGLRQRTTVIAIERNTKVLEQVDNDGL
ncbi:MAG: Rho termination protein, partial [Planctomycetota bacterium]